MAAAYNPCSFAVSNQGMRTKQTIAIIGATGNMGSAIAKSLSVGNYRLLLYARDFNTCKQLAEEILAIHLLADAEAMDCSINASWEADMIIIAAPDSEYKEISLRIREFATQKIIISMVNPLYETYTGMLTAPETSDAEDLQQLLPHSKVVKAVIDSKRVAVVIAGNDQDAVEMVSELMSAAGYHPILAENLFIQL
jgi:predicted dinucleotide-binding enzyme